MSSVDSSNAGSACSPQSSRRSFLRLAGIAAAAMPIMTEGRLAWAAQQAAGAKKSTFPKLPHPTDPNAVMINANENPLGPCDAAVSAIDMMARHGGRYDAMGCGEELGKLLAAEYGLPEDHILVYAGSSEPLQFVSLAYTSPTQSYVAANPTYESGPGAAAGNGAKVHYIPLTSTYAHDVKAMVAADPNAGVIYICNPNNPTGTMTPKEDIVWALDHKPKGTILLVDEAYIHIAGDPKELSVMDQVAAGKDLIVLRTFSKIYGMAGIRCGVAVGRPDLLAKLMVYGMNPMPITGVAAACASLKQPDLVPARRKIIADTRNQTFEWLTAKGYKFIPSVSNCFMIDTGKPGREVMVAMQKHNVYIGRTWPVWPNYVRITVGTPAEMAKFQEAFVQVLPPPAGA
jgi:histidinol-phosphate aminotransferase